MQRQPSRQDKEFRQRAGYAAALLLGMLVIVNSPPILQVFGGVAACVGAIGLLSEGYGYLKQIQAARIAAQREAERQEKKAQRRKREADLKTLRQAERQTQQRAEQLRHEAEVKAEEERRQTREAEANRRASRERAIQTEAERLFAFDAEDFVAAVYTAFAGESGTIEAGNREGEYLCRYPDGTAETLFIIAEEREATREDMEALEAFRRDANAEHGSLISRNGFDAEAVRLSASFPVLLLDPYLVAKKSVR